MHEALAAHTWKIEFIIHSVVASGSEVKAPSRIRILENVLSIGRYYCFVADNGIGSTSYQLISLIADGDATVIQDQRFGMHKK